MPAIEVLPNMWLGDIRSALDLEFLTSHRITTIINCTVKYPFPVLSSGSGSSTELQCYRVAVRDRGIEEDFEMMYKYLLQVVPLIQSLLLDNQRVLIHCYAGCHRSVCLVLGYLMHYGEFTLQESINVLQSKWDRVGLNFLQSLVRYSLQLSKNHLIG